jgi:hypothetical protein
MVAFVSGNAMTLSGHRETIAAGQCYCVMHGDGEA